METEESDVVSLLPFHPLPLTPFTPPRAIFFIFLSKCHDGNLEKLTIRKMDKKKRRGKRGRNFFFLQIFYSFKTS